MALPESQAPPDDSSLVLASLSGDAEAFRLIIERHQDAVCAVAYSAVRDFDSSEDLAQETFIKAWQHLKELRDPGRLRAWLCGIARNLAASFHRKQTRTPTATAAPIEIEAISLPAPGLSAADQAIRHEQEAIVREAIESLPNQYREPLILYYRQDRSVREVAEALEVSEDTAKMRIHRARERLKEEVERMVESALVRSKPPKTFALAVVAALPMVGLPGGAVMGGLLGAKGVASEAVAGKAAAGGAASKTAVTGLGWLTAAFGSLLGILGGVFATWMSIRHSQSRRQREFAKKLAWVVWSLAITFAVVLGGSILVVDRLHVSKGVMWGYFGTLLSLYLIVLLSVILWANRKERCILLETEPDLIPPTPQLPVRLFNNPKAGLYGALLGVICGTLGYPVRFLILAPDALVTALFVLAAAINAVAVTRTIRRPAEIFRILLWAVVLLGPLNLVLVNLRWEAIAERPIANALGPLWLLNLAGPVMFLAAIAGLLILERKRKTSGSGHWIWWRFRIEGKPITDLRRIREFHPARDEVREAAEVASEGEAWFTDTPEPRRFRLFTVTEIPADCTLLLYEALVKTEGFSGHAYLELWVRIPGRGIFYGRGHGFQSVVSGSQGWTPLRVPFFLGGRSRPASVSLNLILDGAGSAWIRDIRLSANG